MASPVAPTTVVPVTVPSRGPAYEATPTIVVGKGRRVDRWLRVGLAAGLGVLAYSFVAPDPAPSIPTEGAVVVNPGQPSRDYPAGSLDAAEASIAAYVAEPDDAGSYMASAEDLVHAFGAEFAWTSYLVYDMCAAGDSDTATVVAFYCPHDPWLVHLNSDNRAYPEYTYTRDFIATVRHELAHLAIARRCGYHGPDFPDVEEEGITNSYAVTYLGADAALLAEDGDHFPEYRMTTQTRQAAVAIHAGDC